MGEADDVHLTGEDTEQRRPWHRSLEEQNMSLGEQGSRSQLCGGSQP